MSIAFDADLEPRGRYRPTAPIIVAGLAVMAMAAVGARAWAVRIAPRTAILFEAAGIPVNLTGLSLERVTAKVVADGARRVLVVEGDVANSSAKDEAVMPLSVSVRGERGEPLYTWATRAPRQTIQAGERAAFTARLASPPVNGVDVVVEFDKGERENAGKAGVARSQVRSTQGSRTESQ